MSNQCPYCGSIRNVCVSPESFRYVCLACEKFFCKGEQTKQTLYDRITQSPEVLAEKLVYNRVYMEQGGDLSYWVSSYFSTIIPGKSWEYEAEAIDATVAKLKEVAD